MPAFNFGVGKLCFLVVPSRTRQLLELYRLHVHPPKVEGETIQTSQHLLLQVFDPLTATIHTFKTQGGYSASILPLRRPHPPAPLAGHPCACAESATPYPGKLRGWASSKPWIWGWVAELVSLPTLPYPHHQGELSSTAPARLPKATTSRRQGLLSCSRVLWAGSSEPTLP